MAAADQDRGRTGGSGYPGAAPAAETASRMASAAGATPEEAGPQEASGEGREPVAGGPSVGVEREPVAAASSVGMEREPVAAAPFVGMEREPVAVPAPAQASGASAALETDTDPETAVEPEAVFESENHEAMLERDLEDLTAKAEKADEYLELAQRTKADFENYRKRAAREAAAAQERGMVKLARELLPAVDNLDRALAAARTAVPAHGGEPADDGSATLVSGIKLVHADVIAALARVGIEPFSPQGEPFDPQYHEAIAQQPIEGAEPGTVVEVYQRGFRLGDSVLRPARVVVAG
jgi:molecular chaperone GrpE